MSHVVGKAVITYFSWDARRFLPRFTRILNPIEDDEVFREQQVLNQISSHRSPPSSPALPAAHVTTSAALPAGGREE
jgi:signal peptidase I